MATDSVAIVDVCAWLPRVHPNEAWRLLVGCLFDDDRGAVLPAIVGVDAALATVVLQGGRRVRLGSVPKAEIVDSRPGCPLLRAVAGSWTAAEVIERGERAALARAGIDAAKLASRECRVAALSFMRDVELGLLPTAEQRRNFYVAMTAAGDRGLARIGARLMSTVLVRHEASGSVPDDAYWRLAYFLRASGQVLAAVAVSEVLHVRPLHDAGARRLLAATRAGALLDLFEMRRRPALLVQAERALKVAYALGRDDEDVRMGFRRYEALCERYGIAR